jgi:hypothetical protein
MDEPRIEKMRSIYTRAAMMPVPGRPKRKPAPAVAEAAE